MLKLVADGFMDCEEALIIMSTYPKQWFLKLILYKRYFLG